jgi:hypothetical protein
VIVAPLGKLGAWTNNTVHGKIGLRLQWIFGVYALKKTPIRAVLGSWLHRHPRLFSEKGDE